MIDPTRYAPTIRWEARRAAAHYGLEADDVAQEAARRLLSGRPPKHAHWSAYARAAVWSTAGSLARGRARGAARELATRDLRRGVDPGDAARIDARLDVAAAVARLPERDRLVLDGTYRRGLSTYAVAREIGRTQAAVVKRLQRVRAALAESLSAYAPED